jgi:hypothetical protein
VATTLTENGHKQDDYSIEIKEGETQDELEKAGRTNYTSRVKERGTTANPSELMMMMIRSTVTW